MKASFRLAIFMTICTAHLHLLISQLVTSPDHRYGSLRGEGQIVAALSPKAQLHTTCNQEMCVGVWGEWSLWQGQILHVRPGIILPRYPAASECIKEGAFGEVNKMLFAAAIETFRHSASWIMSTGREGWRSSGCFYSLHREIKPPPDIFLFWFFFGEVVVLLDARKVHIPNKPVPRVSPFINLPPPKRRWLQPPRVLHPWLRRRVGKLML